jgi:hypothetical protein
MTANFSAASQEVCWFLDAGNNERPARSTGRRPKSAKARSRGKLGTGSDPATPAIAVLSIATDLSALAPAQRAGAQRLRALAHRVISRLRGN